MPRWVRVGLLSAVLATTSACQCFSISGDGSSSSSGGLPPVPCPANSARLPNGACQCFANYIECPGDAGEPICAT